ncbi:hypothetical protein [Pseudacidovorax intermedius]|uniref:hypothetical protein n=1 Tax=Pseudacidovorax intermedius TaxID=433924 RepID=UPI0026F332E5|nr:hypothetical protein [Pseudacidovorax intermedius]
MRLFILVLALVLLPLRGWLEGAMAVEVTTAAASQTQTHSHDAAHAPTPALLPLAMADQPGETSAHCHESQAMTSGAHDHSAHAPVADATPTAHHGDDGSGSHDHGHCGLCQICHSVAMTDAMQAAPLPPPVRVQPQGHAPHFASALLAQADKPPIS